MAEGIEDTFKLALAQLNPVVGDIEGNLDQGPQGARALAKTPARI